MSQPIDDSYIESIIKDNQGATTDPTKTSGRDLRELIKRLRDEAENNNNYKLAGGANAIKIVSWDEFIMSTKIKLDKYGRPLNSFYDYNILGKDIADCRTDAVYTVKNYLSKISQIGNYILQPIWYMTMTGSTGVDTNTIYPALGSVYVNLDQTLNNKTVGKDNQWSVNNLIPFPIAADMDREAVKFDGTSLIGGTPSDDGFVEFARFIAGLGIKVGIDPWFIGISRDPVASGASVNAQTWRGYLTPDAPTNSNQIQISDFDAFCVNYTNFMKYYVDLMRNNAIDLGIYYIGSEYASISTTANETTRRKWITTLINVAKYAKTAFPDCITVYAANWQGELNTSYQKFTLDELWASPYIDRFGCDFYPGITEDITDVASDLASGLVSGEASDFNYLTSPDPNDPTSYAYQQKLSTSSKKGKSGLKTSPILGNIGDKNIAGFLNKYHYHCSQQPGSQPIAAKETLLPGDDLTKAFSNVSILSNNGTPVFPTYQYYPLLYGRYNMEIADAPEETICFVPLGGSGGLYVNYSYPILNQVSNIAISLSFRTFGSLLPSGSPLTEAILMYLPGRFKLYYDTTNFNSLTLSWYQNDGSVSTKVIGIAFEPDTWVKIRIGLDNGNLTFEQVNANQDGNQNNNSIMSPDSGKTFNTSWSISSIGTANTLYLFQDEAGNYTSADELYQFSIGDSDFAFAWYFEEQYALGTRTAYVPKAGMITEFGIAAIGGSAVQSNAFPFATATFLSDSHDVDFSDSGPNKDIGNLAYWRSLADNSVYVKEVYGPYGSNFQSDESGQAVGNTVVNDFLEGHGFDIRCLYCADLRPPENFKFTLNGQLYFIDSPGYGLGHSITGKLSNGVGSGDILTRMKTETPPPLIGTVLDSFRSGLLPTNPDEGKPLLSNFTLTGTNSGNTVRGSTPTGTEPNLQQNSNGILFEYSETLEFKPDLGAHPYPFEQPDGSFYDDGTIYFDAKGYTYKVPVKAVCLENVRYPKTNWSQYTMTAVIKANTGYTISPNQVGIGITGKNIPFYITSSYLVVDFASGQLHLKTRRGSASFADVTVYQINADEDIKSPESFTNIDYNQDFYFTYKRNRFFYTWSVTHNGQTITMHQPDGWKGGGKMGCMSIVNFGGSYLIKDFKVTYDVAKDLDWYIAGASITEGNESDVWRSVLQSRCAFNAEGGNREYEFILGGQDDLENISSCKFASWDFAVNGLNYVLNTYGTTPDYTYADLLNYNITLIDKILSLPGLQKIFLVLLTPNTALIPGVREFNTWALRTFGPDTSYAGKVVFIDPYRALNWPDPLQPVAGVSNDNDDGSLNPAVINLDVYGGSGYLYGYSADGLHPSARDGYRLKTELQLAIMRPYIDAERNGTEPYVGLPQLAAPDVTFEVANNSISLRWSRQASLPNGVIVTYTITSNSYQNTIYADAGLTFTHGPLTSGANYTYSIIARAAGYLDSPSNNYIIKSQGGNDLDPATVMIMNAAGISSSGTYGTISGEALITALDKRVKDLKGITDPSFNIWSKITQWLPLLGNTPDTFKINGVSPGINDAIITSDSTNNGFLGFTVDGNNHIDSGITGDGLPNLNRYYSFFIRQTVISTWMGAYSGGSVFGIDCNDNYYGLNSNVQAGVTFGQDGYFSVSILDLNTGFVNKNGVSQINNPIITDDNQGNGTNFFFGNLQNININYFQSNTTFTSCMLGLV